MAADPSPRLGRLLSHDPRSRQYEAPRRAARPVSWLHRVNASVLDQDGTNGCTGFAGANLLNHAIAAEARARLWGRFGPASRRYLGDAQGLGLYRWATRHDEFGFTYPPTDGGSSGLGVAKALQAMGVIGRYEWTFDFGNALGWAQKQPVLVGSLSTEPMFTPDARGVIHIGSEADLRAAADSGMGHEYVWRGCRWDKGLARIRNSWTESWGVDGDAYLPLEDLRRLLGWQGDVCVPTIP